MKQIEIDFTIYSSDNVEGEASIVHGFHDKIIRSILKDASAFRKEYERDTGEELPEGDYTFAEGIDLNDVLFESQYNDIYNECIEEAKRLETPGKIKILIDTDLASFLHKLDESGD